MRRCFRRYRRGFVEAGAMRSARMSISLCPRRYRRGLVEAITSERVILGKHRSVQRYLVLR